MTIELDDSLVAIWNAALPNGDFLCGLRRRPTGGWEALYRFRYYRDDKLFEDSADERHWYKVTFRHAPSEDEVIAELRSMMDLLPQPQWEILRGARSTEEFAKLLYAMPGIHHKTVDAP